MGGIPAEERILIAEGEHFGRIGPEPEISLVNTKKGPATKIRLMMINVVADKNGNIGCATKMDIFVYDDVDLASSNWRYMKLAVALGLKPEERDVQTKEGPKTLKFYPEPTADLFANKLVKFTAVHKQFQPRDKMTGQDKGSPITYAEANDATPWDGVLPDGSQYEIPQAVIDSTPKDDYDDSVPF